MISFMTEKCMGMWLLLAEHIMRFCNTERDRKPLISGRDDLLMLLAVLKHAQKWDFITELFEVHESTFGKLIVDFFIAVSEHK